MRPPTTVEALPQRWAAKLIERLQALYGAKFTDQWGGISPARLNAIWAEELSGFSGEEIACGLQACRSRPFPPTLPEFLRLCRPWLDPEIAHRIAVDGLAARRKGNVGVWPHPAIYWAAVSVGTHDLLAATFGAIRSRWELALREELARGQWASVPAPAAALPAPGSTITTNAEGIKKVEQLAQQVVSKSRRLDKGWAAKILANPKRYTESVVQMARRAMGIDGQENS